MARRRLPLALTLVLLCAACAGAPPQPVEPAPPAPAETSASAPPSRPIGVPLPPQETPLALPSGEPGAPGVGGAVPPPEELLAEGRDRELRGDRLAAELLYRRAVAAGGGAEAREDLARVLLEEGRFADAADALGEPDPLALGWTDRMWFLRGQALEGEDRPVEAARAYGRVLDAADPASREAARRRLEVLVGGLGPEDLGRLADACPFCPEGGRARLRLARQALDAGRVDEARQALETLTSDFAGGPVGDAAEELLEGLRPDEAPAVPGSYGLLLPLSGSLEPFGRRALRGALLASGLFSQDEDPGLHFEVVDSRGEPAAAAAGVEELARRGVVGIVGPLKGVAAREAARRARELAIPLLTLTPADDVAGGWAFRLYLRESDEVARLVEYAVRERGMRRFAILYPDTDLGLRYRDLFWDEVVAQGGEITGVEAIPAGERDVADAIERLTGVYALTPAEVRERFVKEERIRLRREGELLAALGIGTEEAHAEDLPVSVDEERLKAFRPKPVVDFDAVFLPVASLEAAQIAPQFPFHDVVGVTLLGIRSWNYPTLTEVGEEYVEGAIFASETHPALPGARELTAAYLEAYGEPSGVIGAYAYDAVGLLAAFHRGTQTETRTTLRRSLASVWAAAGATGPLTSHPGGDIACVPKILTVRRGRIVPVAGD